MLGILNSSMPAAGLVGEVVGYFEVDVVRRY